MGVWLIVLLLVAALLFLFGPSLLGLVADDGGAASPSPSATVAITPTPVPTEPPAPTPQVYIVAKGDTMSKIAKKFGLTVEEILAANPQIKNADKIEIGDEITIPAPTPEGSCRTTGPGGGVRVALTRSALTRPVAATARRASG